MQLINLKPQETYSSVPMLSGWSTRTILEIKNVGCNANLIQQQVLVDIQPEYWGFTTANFNNNGSDIRFTDLNNNIIPHNLVTFSKIGRVLKAWIKLDLPVKGQRYIFCYYGNAGASSTSDGTIMERYSANSNTGSLVRFNDGSGTTASNIGTLGGTFTLNGGYTWQSADMFGGTTNSLLLNGTSGYVSKTGQFDSWPQNAFISINVNFSSITGEQTIFCKVNRLKTSSPDEGDYLYFYKRSDHKLGLDVFRGSTQNKTYTGINTISAGIWNSMQVRWTFKDRQGQPPAVRYKMEVYLNGVLEITTDNTTILPDIVGSIGAWMIGAKLSNVDGTTVSNYLNGSIQDHIIETKYPSSAKLESIYQNRKYYAKNQASKFIVSDNLDSGGLIDVAAGAEPCLLWDNNMWRLYYINVKSFGQSDIMYKETSSLSTTSTNTWSTPILIKALSNNGIVRKFGNTYYLYYRAASGNGPISVATSTDGYTFGSPTVVLPNAASGFGSTGYFNTDVIFNPKDNLYYMYVEARYPVNVYIIGMATCSTPNGTFILNTVNPTNLLYGDGTGNCGGPSSEIIGNMVYMWYHCDPVSGVLPMEGYFAYTTLDNMLYFEKPKDGNYLKMDRPKEADQAADITVKEGNNEVVMMHNQVCNTNPLESYLTVSKYPNAELIHLVSDFNIIIRGQSRIYETETNAMIGLGLTNLNPIKHADILDRRIKDLKGYYNPNYPTSDVWSKIIAYYPLIGGNANLHKFNIINPQDLDSAYRWVYSGSVTHNNLGTIFNGTGYVNTKLTVNTIPLNNIAITWHITTGSANGTFVFGAFDSTNQAVFGSYGIGYSQNTYDAYYHLNNGRVTTTSIPVAGYHGISRTNASTLKAFRTGTQIGTTQTFTNPYLSQPSREFYIGCRSLNGSPNAYSAFTLGDFKISSGLTDTEIQNEYYSQLAKDTALGRA